MGDPIPEVMNTYVTKRKDSSKEEPKSGPDVLAISYEDAQDRLNSSGLPEFEPWGVFEDAFPNEVPIPKYVNPNHN